MHLGWLSEVRGEHLGDDLLEDTQDMGQLLNITEGIQLEKTKGDITKLRAMINEHVMKVVDIMQIQEDKAMHFLHRDMEDASMMRHPWIERQFQPVRSVW